tara:strand:- start:91 stop:603 length:513 start_codon:yes stop_codon:yes gene_type:complete
MSLNAKLESMLQEHIKSVKETDESWWVEFGKADDDHVEDPDAELDEISVTGAGEAFDSPMAFTPKKKKKKKAIDDVNESNFMRIAKQSYLAEASYTSYKRDDTLSSKQKVNKAIKDVNSKLFVIERLINQNVKLKTEDGVDSTAYWKSTRTNLYKISEKMMRISEKIRRF